MFSSSHSIREREQEFPPLLFSLTAVDGNAVVTPRTSSRIMHRDDSSMSAQRRSANTPGSVHTETTPPTPPPPVMRLNEDVVMEDPSTSKPGTQGMMPPPMQSLSPNIGQGVMDLSYERTFAPEYEDVWVTVFGFAPGDTSLILKEFSKCGDILQWGSYGQPNSNFLHLQYQNKYAAQRALLRNGDLLSVSLIIGVKPPSARHRAAIHEYLAAGGHAEGQQISISRPQVLQERSYRFQAQTQVVMPQPRTAMSKVVEFVFGF
ncbi:hypothetical protein CEUSTIGMA_g2269.t1 [Chlamydomonas eustigma]|uniref:RRM Nup35-type domain-containing protein n=1 Tax=Chlamydomonas eustigma TaxID=1157962 RepID=A0A250WW24_9CHLO|nr:hypothetical protein CEUSTIGMA_g2269.t1 [Chlamydomonas eustigma]|eukprot:GAX74822.1 hypothetical protein CEUSTIGMA_g2269.t1 [Chlamydomonas eustigma]